MAKTKADLEAELARIRERDSNRVKRWRETNAGVEAQRRAARGVALAAIKERYPDEYSSLVAACKASGTSTAAVYRQAGSQLREAHRAEYDEVLAEQQ